MSLQPSQTKFSKLEIIIKKLSKKECEMISISI